MTSAFEFADGLVKQILTLATGSLGGIVAIFDNGNVAGVQLAGSGWLTAAIALLAISIAAGVVTLGCLTGQLARPDGKADANALGVRLPAMVQMSTFAAAMLAAAAEVALP